LFVSFECGNKNSSEGRFFAFLLRESITCWGSFGDATVRECANHRAAAAAAAAAADAMPGIFHTCTYL
jgi:hypothetical protein